MIHDPHLVVVLHIKQYINDRFDRSMTIHDAILLIGQAANFAEVQGDPVEQKKTLSNTSPSARSADSQSRSETPASSQSVLGAEAFEWNNFL